MRRWASYPEPLTCGNCGIENEVATAALGPPGPPGEGAFAICWTCGAVHEKRAGRWVRIEVDGVADFDTRNELRRVVRTWVETVVDRHTQH